MKKYLWIFVFVITLCFTSALSETIGENPMFAQDVIDRSLVSIGNTERLHQAIAKAQQGEPITIVYMGGSITEGGNAEPQETMCYAYVSANLFAERFMSDSKQLNYVNTGISSTNSLLGVTRVQRDVLSLNPDIVFVEYASNDGTDLRDREVYESLVRKLLNSEVQPAVILLFTQTNRDPSPEGNMRKVGERYDLGMISVHDALEPLFTAGVMTVTDFADDEVHPTTEGHALIAALIDNYMAKAAQTAPTPYQMPEKVVFGKRWEGVTNIVNGDAAIVSEGSFRFGEASCYSYTSGWVYDGTQTSPEPLVLQVVGNRMSFVFKQENDPNCATVQIWVDGDQKKLLSGYSTTAWGNVVTEMVLLGGSGEHTVEIRIQEADAGKRFSLLDMGLAP